MAAINSRSPSKSACRTPGWAWFSGVSSKDALIRTKTRFTGDQEVQFYAGAKALPSGEAMRDIIVRLLETVSP